MSDEELSKEEILLQQQRKEKKELQAKIQALKKSSSKGDKKKKKETTEEIARLEFELNEKHEKELKELSESTTEEKSKSNTDTEVNSAAQSLEIVKIEESNEDGKRISKAQKRRDKKAEKEKERLEDISRQEEENKLGQRHIEAEKIKAILSARGLKIKDIPSDGDCLFAGVIHQLQNNSKVSELRRLVADMLLSQKDDFQPFLSLEDSEFEDYCEKMATTPKWGGQIEITALSRVLRKPIEVIQAEGPIVQVGNDEFKDQKPIVLTYHRHYYGLGEHYNSVQSIT